MSQSKVVAYDIREEVVDLLVRGKGPAVIAGILNAEHSFPVPLNHVNIINFRNSLGEKMLATIDRKKQTELQRVFMKPLEEARSEMAEIRDRVLPAYFLEISKDAPDTKLLMAYHKVFTDTFDRMAKLEGIIEPRGAIRDQYIQINQQFNDVIGKLVDVMADMCPTCRSLLIDRLGNLQPDHKEVITVDPLRDTA